VNVDVAVAAAQHTRDWLDYAGTLLALLGVIVVGLYTYYAKKQNELTENALIYGNRAWLVPRIGWGEIKRTEAGGWTLRMYFHNHGSVPGIVVKTGAQLWAQPPGPINTPNVTLIPSGVIVVPGVGDQNLRGFNVPHFDAEERELETGEKILYAVCRVDYTDPFRKDWSTTVVWFRRDGDWSEASGQSKMT
jgi:hypothetical protein